MPLPEDPRSGHRFVIEIGGEKIAAFTECTLPSFEFEITEQKEGGLNDFVHVLHGGRKTGRVTLKRGLTASRTLFKWYEDLLQGKIKKATKMMAVIMYDVEGNEMARWDFTDVMPVKWSGPQLKADTAAVAIESLELIVHDYIP